MRKIEIEILDKEKISKMEILTRREAAVYLGFSLRYINSLCSKKVIPYYRPSYKRTFFKRSELDEWVMKNKVE